MPGYCGGISLGNWKELDRLSGQGIDEKERPVLWFLIRGDFHGLLAFAKEYGYQEEQGGYFLKCHLCVDIRKFLVNEEDFKELRPVEFYSRLNC